MTKVTPQNTSFGFNNGTSNKTASSGILSLPTEKSKIENDFLRFSYFIHGLQKIGKTTFTAQFPDAIHLMFEPGAKTEEIYQVAPKNWREVEQYITLLRSPEGERFKTVIIDTVDLMFDMCSKAVCDEAGVEMLKDIGFGDGYKMVGNKFRNALIKIHDVKGLVMLAHSKDKMKTNDSDPDMVIPSTMKTGAEVIEKWADLTGHYYIKSNGKRFLKIRPSTTMTAGTRIKKHFEYTDGNFVHDIPMGGNEEEAFANFIKAFNNELENPKAPKKSFGFNKPKEEKNENKEQ